MKSRTYVLNMLTLIALALIGVWSITTLIIEDIHEWAEVEESGSYLPALTPALTTIRTAAKTATLDDLLDAIEFVESKCDADAIGDGGNAVGSFQIWKIYVDDVNRINRLHGNGTRYMYGTRRSRKFSREMATIYLKHYGGTFEEMARKHNGGPQGHKKESTKAYWLKVKARMAGE